MKRMFEELDYQETSMGELVLRRRRSLHMPDTIVYEVKLDGEFLMSSLVRSSEEALADLPLSKRNDTGLKVLVGGLGLGHTAAAALAYPNVERVDVIEYLAPIIDWHRHRLVPAADTLLDDPRCQLIEADFFNTVAAGDDRLADHYDAVLVDIDHAPEVLLDDRHGSFYSKSGMTIVEAWLNPGGAFSLWSADKPGDAFVGAVKNAFATPTLHPITFTNPNFEREEENWILVAEKA